MFTGIIEALGKINHKETIDGGIRLSIDAVPICSDLSIGDSVAVNGVCLTATSVTAQIFTVDAVGETLQKTNIGKLQVNQPVNLERAMTAGARLGGHIVQGHVNGIGRISNIIERGENYFLEVRLPQELLRYVILEGSIALDGISLTIATLREDILGFNIIPHTWTVTNLSQKAASATVNVEVDVMAKYIERLMRFQSVPLSEENTV